MENYMWEIPQEKWNYNFKNDIIMELSKFIENFADQFDDTDSGEITASTAFHELDEYSSLIALSIIAMVDEEYDVQLKGDDMRSAVTVEDLFNIVKSKMA